MRNRDRIAAVFVIVTLAVALLAVGSVLRWTVLLSAVLATVCATPYLTSQRHITSFSPLLLFLVAVTGFTALQVIPLPAALVELLSPGKYELVVGNAKALGQGAPRFMVLSYDPAATLLELAKFASYVLFAFACLRLSAFNKGRRALWMAVAGAGVVLALIAHTHQLLGLSKLYGVYTPSWKPRFLSPLLNENHIAGFLAMTTPICLGLAVLERGLLRLVWLSSAVICTGTVLLSQSRGGVAALVIGLLITGSLLLLQRKRGTRDAPTRVPLSVLIPAGVVTLCVCVLLGAFTAGGVAKEFARTSSAADVTDDQSKIHAWRESGALLRANRWTGVGRGGFEFAFTRVRSSTKQTFSHVENEYLQAVLDWGVPMAAALALAMILLIVIAVRRWQSGPVAAAALGGLAAIGLQNVVDFNLEFPSVALAAIALAATVIPPALSKSKRGSTSIVGRARIPALVVATLVIGVAMTPRSSTARSDAKQLEARLRDKDADSSALIGTATKLFERHPSDYVIAGLTAQAMFREPARRSRAFEVVKRALALNPRHAGLNQLAARMLLNADPPRTQDALIQYAVALMHIQNPRPLLTELRALFPVAAVAVLGLPLNAERAEVLCGYLFGQRANELALLYAQRLAVNLPNDSRALGLVALAAFHSGKNAAALKPARRAFELRPTTAAAILLAKVELATANPRAAAKVIATAEKVARRRGASREIVKLLFLKARVLYSAAKYAEAKAVAKELLGIVSRHNQLRLVHLRLAKIEAKLGNHHQARWERRRAQQLRRGP